MRMPISPVVAIIVANLGVASCDLSCGPDSRYVDPAPESYSATTVAVRANGVDETVAAARVTGAFFEGPRAVPLLGRSFTPDEYRQLRSAVTMVSHGYWKSRLGGSPEIIGQQIEIEGRPRTIVGIGPPNFAPKSTQIWLPGLR